MLRSKAHVEAICFDYRESRPFGLDFAHDKESLRQEHRIQALIRVLWGSRGVIQLVYGTEQQLAFWKACCKNLDSKGNIPVDSGHYIPKEQPDIVFDNTLSFFALS